VSRSGAALQGGLPSDGKLSCWGCDTSCSQRFECAACLEIYRDRATKAANDCASLPRRLRAHLGRQASRGAVGTDSDWAACCAGWERAFFCRESCFQAHWCVAPGPAARAAGRDGRSSRAEHAKRHGPSSFGPCRQDTRTHNFAGAPSAPPAARAARS
jgi:hypothetical protein